MLDGIDGDGDALGISPRGKRCSGSDRLDLNAFAVGKKRYRAIRETTDGTSGFPDINIACRSHDPEIQMHNASAVWLQLSPLTVLNLLNAKMVRCSISADF